MQAGSFQGIHQLHEIEGCAIDSHGRGGMLKRRSITCSDDDSIRNQYLTQLGICILTEANRSKSEQLSRRPVRCAPIPSPAATALRLAAVVSLF